MGRKCANNIINLRRRVKKCAFSLDNLVKHPWQETYANPTLSKTAFPIHADRGPVRALP
jgi:hypothetical protein